MKKMKYMKKVVCAAVSVSLLMPGFIHRAWAEENEGPGVGLDGSSYSYTPPAEIGPGVSVTVGANDFLHLEVQNPIVHPVEKYSYDQMAADIVSLQNAYGDKVHVNVIGTSLDGRNIYDIIVGNPSASQQILIQGGIHAREYMTPLLMMSQVEFALSNYDTGHYNRRALSDMFQQTAIHFVPMSNPDGVSLSQFGLEAIRSEALRQGILASYQIDTEKQRTSASFDTYLTKWKGNAGGIDLNHNFDADWNGLMGNATFPSYAGYKGPSPLSEPESRALAELSGQHSWAATISYHSQGEIIYWDCSTSKQKTASESLAKALSSMTGYRLDGSDGKGGYKDWMQSKADSTASVTLEVGKTACPVPFGEYQTVWQQNKGVWVQAMDYVIKRK